MKKIKSRYEKKKILTVMRGMVGIILVLVLFFRGMSVLAGMNDSQLEKNRMDGIYAIASFNGESRIFYLNMYTLNGITSYCIELGVDVTTNIYHSTSDFGMSYLSNEQIEYIRSISYFGYMYPGHEDYHYYMAAQELIWEYISGGQVDWSHDLSLDGDRIDVDSYKNEILFLREAYYNGLSFDFENYGVYSIGERLILHDRSGILSRYEVESSGHSNVWIEGDYLYIDVATTYVGEESIILKRKEDYSYPGKLYYYDNSQRLISAGNLDMKREEISFYIKGGQISFQVVDRYTAASVPNPQASFEGATYDLYDANGNLLETFIADSNGFAVVDNLPSGDYIVQQTVASEGYLLNSAQIFLYIQGLSTFIYLDQVPISQRLEIFKLYNYNGDSVYEPEPDISFTVFDIWGNYYGSLTTNSKGKATLDLFYGHYIVHQENSTYGYAKVDDFEVFITDNGEGFVRYDLIDDFVECQLRVVAKDKDYLFVNLGAGFEYKIWSESLGEYLNYNGEEVFSTDESGELFVPVLLNYGAYRIEEVGVPSNFINCGQSYEFIVDEHSDFIFEDGILYLSVEFFHDRKMGKVNIVTDQEVFFTYLNGYEYKYENRSDVVLDLISKEDIVLYENIVYQKDTLIQTVTTDEEGIAFMDSLYLGNYCLVERESGLKECFILDNISNSLNVKLSLLLEKMDIEFFNRSESGESIGNVLVEVLDKDKKVIYTGITDEEGIFKIKDLPIGQYCFQQKKISDKYLINEDISCVEIDSSKKIWNVEVVNFLSPKKLISVPNTFDDGVDVKKIILIVLLGVGGFLYKKKLCFFTRRK